MTRKGLHPRDAELLAAVRAAGDGARDVAIAAAQAALARNPVTESPVPDIVAALDRADLARAVQLHDALEQLVERLDEEYFALDSAGPAVADASVMAAFGRARAAAALDGALQADPVEAAMDAIYEAYHAMPDEDADGFLDAVRQRLRDRLPAG